MDGLTERYAKIIEDYCLNNVKQSKALGYTKDKAWEVLNARIDVQEPDFDNWLKQYRKEMSGFRSEKGGKSGFPKGYAERMSNEAKIGRAVNGIMRRSLYKVYGKPDHGGGRPKKTAPASAEKDDKVISPHDLAYERIYACAMQLKIIPVTGVAASLIGVSHDVVESALKRMSSEGWEFTPFSTTAFMINAVAPKPRDVRLKELQTKMLDIMAEIEKLVQ